MIKVKNRYKNKKTGEIKDLWETKKQYENQSFEFERDWEQISYPLNEVKENERNKQKI